MPYVLAVADRVGACQHLSGMEQMAVEFVNLDPAHDALCKARHLSVQRGKDNTVVVIDQDPLLRAKKKKLPRYEGADVESLICLAIGNQNVRNGDSEDPAAVTSDIPANCVEPVVSQRVVIEDTSPPTELGNVTLDDTAPTRRTTRRNKPEKVHRDNRLARAFRAIIENPTKTVAAQAKIAEVTEPMLRYYEIQLRSVYRIIYEKHGENVIPALPALR
jgi:hypothetical protein